MSKLLKATLLLLGAIAVLLLAGGFPPAGIPAVYHGGAMLLAGYGVWGLCLWGMCRLARGHWPRFILGLASSFLAFVGLVGLWRFGAESCHLATLGGAMWFGAVAMGCLAVIGVLFACIFGFLAWRLMSRKLWLAALHLCLALTLTGAWLDFLYEDSTLKTATVGKNMPAEEWEFGSFRAAITSFGLERYDGAETYTLLSHENGRWAALGTPLRRGDSIEMGGKSLPISDMKFMTRGGARFSIIPGQPLRVLQEIEAPVKDYRATIRFTTRSGGKPDEVREETLQVNKPATCQGLRFYLMSYRPVGSEQTEVHIMVRRAPGRALALCGFIGLLISAAGWSFGPRQTTLPS